MSKKCTVLYKATCPARDHAYSYENGMRKNYVIARRAKPDEAIQVCLPLTKWANFSLDCFAFARNDTHSLNLFSYEQVLARESVAPRKFEKLALLNSYLRNVVYPNLAKQDWAQSRQGDLGSQATDKNEEAILISAEKNINIDKLKEKIYNKLSLIRVYLKEVGKKPDLQTPLIMRQGATVKDVCEKLHRDFVAKFKFARVWGKSAKFPGQKFKIDHKLADKDVVEIRLR